MSGRITYDEETRDGSVLLGIYPICQGENGCELFGNVVVSYNKTYSMWE